MGKEVENVFKYIDCIDAGTEYCPCSLAERGECIICSQLKDKVFCDCLNWKGTCIYQEFMNNHEKASKTSRQFVKYDVINKEYIRKDLFLLDIAVSKTLARELNNLGAYVFLKNIDDAECYSTPISILESNIFTNTIKVAVKVAGVKTKALDRCTKKILVKGPYWNGIQGVKFLKNLKNKNCLILARGVATAPAVLAAKKMKYEGNQVYAVLDPGRSVFNFAKPYFLKHGCTVEDMKFFNEGKFLSNEFRMHIEQLMKKWNFKVVLSAGDDEFHRMIIGFINNIDGYVNFATVNNNTMCCGEGICGSCQIKGTDGESIKTCKQQYNPLEVFLRGKYR
jgi:NAD(P)H-flavin reductase